MDISFRQLEIFQSVVVAGSITKASHRIGLSQPSISQQLAKLEETLDTKLIERNRTGTVVLTPAGEYWLKHAEDILRRMDASLKEHDQLFRHANVVLRLGVTPVLRGRFVTAAAQIALQEPDFVKFELVYDLNSTALAEQLRLHKIHLAVVAESIIAPESAALAVARLYDDHIGLAVPATVPEDQLRYALRPDADPAKISPVLKRFIEIDPAVPTRGPSDEWYRQNLPSAMAVFGVPTFAASAEFVAAGLGTCHLPLSMLPNLPAEVQSRIRVYVIDGMSRSMVIAMRKHLLNHGTYARIFRGIVDFCITDFAPAIDFAQTGRIEHLLSSTGSLRVVGA